MEETKYSADQLKVLTIFHVTDYLSKHGFPTVGIGKMYGSHDQLFIFLPGFDAEDFVAAGKEIGIEIILEAAEED